MDTGAASKSPAQVKAEIERIQTAMPETYKAIKAKADQVGKAAYGLVRRAIRGEPNCFWACERGHVVGTPFAAPAIEAELSQYMVRFGCAYVCMWGPVVQGSSDGTH